jgi:hypothetical protein
MSEAQMSQLKVNNFIHEVTAMAGGPQKSHGGVAKLGGLGSEVSLLK